MITKLVYTYDDLQDDWKVVHKEFLNRTGIYVWTLSPNMSNFERIIPLLGGFHASIIDGRERFAQRRVRVAISSQSSMPVTDKWRLSASREYSKSGAHSLFAEVAAGIAPPIYVGKSFNSIHTRIESHLKSLQGEFGSGYQGDSKKSFAFRLRQLIETADFRDVRIEPRDFGVTLYLLPEDNMMTNEHLEIVENTIISMYTPLGNKKYLR